MSVRVRRYDHESDFARIGRFLVRTYGASADFANWLAPRWEYMHFHPLIADVDRDAIGVWEAGGAIVAVAHPEHRMGAAFLEVDPAHATLKPDLLQYAEDRLSVATGGGRALRVYIDDRDHALQRAATTRGYRRTGDAEPMSRLTLPDPFPEARPPDGFRLRTLAEDNDLGKVHRLLWRGFDHGDEPPEAGLEERRFMQSAPGFRRDLNFVAEAPGGSFVAYCGVWFEPVHRIAYVEPVATDPDYRRRGLGRAVVMGAVRRCGEQGATVAFVGTATPFYLSLGFRQLYNCSVWLREWA